MIKKIISIVMILTVSAWLVGPGVAQAITADELQVQIDALMAQLADLQAELAGLTGETPTVAGCTITSFDRNLSVGDTGTDVNCLQIVLNSSSDTQLASSGVGSSGNETSYFGPLTKGGVIKFQEKYASEVLASWGLTSGTGFVGSTTRAKLDTLLTAVAEEEEEEEEEVPPVASGLGISLASDTPVATSIISYGTTSYQAQVLVPFTAINFTAASEGSVTVTTLKFTRTGIASDSNLDNTYLYEGDAKLLEGGSLSSKVVTFNDANGIFTVPAGETKSITLKGNLNSAASAGKTIGFSLVSADDITSDASTVSGTFSVSGNLMTVATATDLGYAMFTGYTTPVSAATISPQDDYQVWKFTLTANQQNLDLEKIVFSEVGSINVDDLQNFELYYGGTMLGTAEMDSNNQVIFDFSDSPFRITKGQSRVLKLYADIVKGSNRTFKFTIQYPTDLIIKDANYGVYVPSYITLGTWSIVQPTASYTIDTGTLSVTKRTDSPTGNVSLDGTNLSLAKFDFKAAGEDVKVTSLRVAADTSNLANGLDNGMVYLDDVQVGSTIDITEYASGLVGEGTSFTFGTSFIVAAGTTSVVEIKADIKDVDTNSFSATNTIQIYLLYDDTYNNAQAQSSLTILDAPASDKAANSLTVQAGSLTFTKRASYGNQTTTAPTSGYNIGSFSALAGSTEGVNVDSVTVAFSTAEAAKIENLLLKVGAEQIGTTTVTPSDSNLFSINVDLDASEAKTIDIYADLLSTATGTVIADVTGTSTTTVTSAAANVTSAVTLQTITVGTGVLSVNIASDNPDDALVVQGTTNLVMAKYDFSSTYEAFNVSEVRVYASSETDRTSPRYNEANYRDYLNVWLSYPDSSGATVTTSERSTFVNGMMIFTGLTMYVPANGTAKLTVYADLNAVAAAGYAVTGDRPQISLAYYKANSGSIASFERRTGLLRYDDGDSSGAMEVALAWATASADTGNDSTYMQGTYALKMTATDATDGGELDIPISDLNLTIADISSITFSTQTDNASLEGAPLTLFMDCNLDGALDGEIIYNYSVTAVDTWETETLNTSSSVDWWANEATICRAGTSGTTTLPGFTQTAMIVGVSLSVGWDGSGIGDGDIFYLDKLRINTTNYYAVEDDMGALGTNYVLGRTKPTTSLEGTTSGSLVNGTNVLYSVNIAADTAGNVGLKVMTFSVTGTATPVLNTLKLYKGGTDYTAKVQIADSIAGTNSYESTGTDLADGSAKTVYVVFADEEIITEGTSQIYYLKGLVASAGSGDSVQTYPVDDANPYGHSNVNDVGAGVAYATLSGAEFIWTDRSYGSAHTLTSLDWVNGFLVETLGDSLLYTISKL